MEDHLKGPGALILLSGTFVLLVGMDLVSDYRSGSGGGHLALEGILLLVSAGTLVAGTHQLLNARKVIRDLEGNLESVKKEKEHWKEENRELLAGLSAKIEKQFADWQLTPAETEVGFFLLKGFSLKEIADLRGTKLKTIQQQSQALYQKSGLGSRSELAAFFLEDLLPPSGEPS